MRKVLRFGQFVIPLWAIIALLLAVTGGVVAWALWTSSVSMDMAASSATPLGAWDAPAVCTVVTPPGSVLSCVSTAGGATASFQGLDIGSEVKVQRTWHRLGAGNTMVRYDTAAPGSLPGLDLVGVSPPDGLCVLSGATNFASLLSYKVTSAATPDQHWGPIVWDFTLIANGCVPG
jgi:hypothetical protein